MPNPTDAVEREYRADAEVQRDLPTLDVETQTLPGPVMASLYIQTDETPVAFTLIQTDPEPSSPQRIVFEMQVKADKSDFDESSSEQPNGL